MGSDSKLASGFGYDLDTIPPPSLYSRLAERRCTRNRDGNRIGTPTEIVLNSYCFWTRAYRPPYRIRIVSEPFLPTSGKRQFLPRSAASCETWCASGHTAPLQPCARRRLPIGRGLGGACCPWRCSRLWAAPGCSRCSRRPARARRSTASSTMPPQRATAVCPCGPSEGLRKGGCSWAQRRLR